MISRDVEAFLRMAGTLASDFGPATASAAFMVAPDGFARAEESARDNAYMADVDRFDPLRALLQHRALHVAVSGTVPTVCFAGRVDTPDALFPNNVFATAPGRVVVGRMRHPVRQREAARTDIREFFTSVLGLELHDLSGQAHPCELTGALVVDRARGIGWCGLSERCDEAGARSMHAAFGLRATLMFDLAPGEYHTNVLLALLAGRAALVCPEGIADPQVVDALDAVYGPGVNRLTPVEHRAFVANAISLNADTVWMSGSAERAMTALTRAALADAGFGIASVELDAIEAAGGSLRCCVGEIFLSGAGT